MTEGALEPARQAESEADGLPNIAEELRADLRTLTARLCWTLGIGFGALLVFSVFIWCSEPRDWSARLISDAQVASVRVDTLSTAAASGSSIVWALSTTFIVVVIATAALLMTGYITLGRMVRVD